MSTVGAERRKFVLFILKMSYIEQKWQENRGKIGQITQKQGDLKGFLFRLQLNFFPVFWQGEFFPPPPRGSLLAKISTIEGPTLQGFSRDSRGGGGANLDSHLKPIPQGRGKVMFFELLRLMRSCLKFVWGLLKAYAKSQQKI